MQRILLYVFYYTYFIIRIYSIKCHISRTRNLRIPRIQKVADVVGSTR